MYVIFSICPKTSRHFAALVRGRRTVRGRSSNISDFFPSSTSTASASIMEGRSSALPCSMEPSAFGLSGVNNSPSKVKKGESLYASVSLSNDHNGT